MKKDNTTSILAKFIRRLNLSINISKIHDELLTHPDYPGLLAISDVLNTFQIENAAFRVNPDDLILVPCPFIAHTNVNNGDFIIVDKFEGSNIIVSSEKVNKRSISLEEFKKTFAGVVLTSKRSEHSNNYKKLSTFLLNSKQLFTISCIALILVAGLIQSNYFDHLTWQRLILTIVKSLGLIASILLLIQSIDSNNPLVQVLCQNKGKTNCNAILSSKAAKVFDGLTWSEVGFFYFSSTWLLLLFGGSSVALWQILAILNLISLPYTFYSVYYQARVAKQWCVLCCTVQGLLWMELAPTGTIALSSPLTIPAFTDYSPLLICFLLPIILWIMLKPLFLKLQQLPPLKKQLHTFKYNTDLFTQLLTAQPKYAQPDKSWSIVLGNVEANNIITMVTNPYCAPCAATHKLLDELLEQNTDLQARIVFTARNNDDDVKTPVSRHLMALNDTSGKEKVKQALHDWYEQKQKNYEEWARVYPVQLNEANFFKLDKQNEWCQLAEVSATPTLLLNGYNLPNLYQLPDLKYMLE